MKEYNLEILKLIACCDYIKKDSVHGLTGSTDIMFNAVWVDEVGDDSKIVEFQVGEYKYNKILEIWKTQQK